MVEDVTLGDIIVGIDDVDIVTEADLFKALDSHRVGDTVNIRLLRAVDTKTASGTSRDDKKESGVVAVKREELAVKLVLGEKKAE